MNETLDPFQQLLGRGDPGTQQRMKPIDKLTPKDFGKFPVWEYCNDLEAKFADETVVRPITELPVSDLSNRVIGTAVRFANGVSAPAMLCNIDLNNHVHTEHFVTLTLFRNDGAKFHLARYHDIGAETRDSAVCAKFFKLSVAEIFPITYDIGSVAMGVPGSIRRKIPAQPTQRLDADELMRMVIDSLG